jgi:NHL repeat-containing protein
MHRITRKSNKVNRIEHRNETLPGFLLVVALTVASLVLTASSANAAQRHSYSYSFGAPGSAAGQLSLVPAAGNNNNPSSSGIAVDDATNDVYVVDTGNHRVDQFSAAGTFIRAWGWGVVDGAEKLEVCAITCRAGIGGHEPGQFAEPMFIAVDNSTGPSTGDVYVADSQGLITKFTSTGALVSIWGVAGQLDGSTTPGGSFRSAIQGIANSTSGNLLVLTGREFGSKTSASVFTQNGSFQEEFLLQYVAAGKGFAIDDSGGLSGGDIYTFFSGFKTETLKFNSAGKLLSEPDTEPGTGLAVDSSNGDLYVGHAADVAAYDALGNFLARFGSAEPGEGELREPAGLAVDPSNHTVFLADGGSQRIDVFVSVTTPGLTVAPATNLERESASVSGTLNPGGSTPDAEIKECQFGYVEDSVLQALKGVLGADEIFATYGGSSACLNPDGSATAPLAPGTVDHPVHAHFAGLQPGTVYDFRLLARNVNLTESTPLKTFTTLFPFIAPTVELPFVVGVTSSSAALGGEIDPNHYATAYHFEYVDNVTFEADLASGDGFQHASVAPAGADAVIAPTGTEQNVSQLVSGLAPATIYRYRLSADNGHGETLSSVQVFTTQPASSGLTLLDGRVWEMVSPSKKSGSTISGISLDGEGGLQASADGSALAFFANGAFGQEARGDRSFTPSQFLARREATGWSTKDITPPREDVVGFIPGNISGYKVFSQDLSLGALQSRGTTLLSAQATAPTPYLRVTNGEYLPLVNAGNVPPGTVFDGGVIASGFGASLVENEPEIEGGSPDLHSVVLASCFKLTEEAVDYCAEKNNSLYVWHEGALQLVSVLPNGQPTTAVLGGNRHSVSDAGTRLAFAHGHDLYLRDTAVGGTVQLNQPEPGAAGGVGEPRFQDMNTDGSRVFFTDNVRLTTDSNADQSRRDLYMCEVMVEGEALSCALRDLSVADNPGEAGDVLGASLGGDSSGRYVYFVANGELAPGASPGDCGLSQGAGTGVCDLYLSDTLADTIKLVATLSGADFPDWAGGGGDLSASSMRVSPNGRYLAFMSQRSLTGYDNRDAVSGGPDEEVYLYDRLGDGGQGQLVCVSCNPTGARPHGIEAGFSATHQRLINEVDTWNKTWLAAVIPGWTPYSLIATLYQSRYLSDSGRLFFNSVDALAPQDSNGVADVYEYEPPQGEGQPSSNSCTVSSSTYRVNSGGCISLVSSGTSGEESVFLDASESGDDVFFLTASKLSSLDIDNALDIYDARIGGVVPEPVKPPACEGDACQSPVSAPDDSTPGSLTFHGPGNPVSPIVASVKGKAKPSGRIQKLARALKACGRKPKRRRAVCVRRARRAYDHTGKTKKLQGKARKSNWRAN